MIDNETWTLTEGPGWRAGNSETPDHPEMTVESVHAALDEVRPYLIADGGDVTVAAVEPDTGTVFLRLEVRTANSGPSPLILLGVPPGFKVESWVDPSSYSWVPIR